MEIFKWIEKVMHVLIPGLFYMVNVFFLILLSVSNDICAINIDYKDYTLIIVILVLLIAYIIGFSVNEASQWFIWRIKREKLKEKFLKTIMDQDEISNKYGGYFLSLIMIRHLIFSTLSLGPILYFYFLKFGLNKLGSSLILTCLLFFVVLIFAYLQLRTKCDQINKAKEK